MAKPIETLKIAIDFKDQGSQAVIKKIVGSLEQLQQAASKSRPRIMGLRKEILAQGQASAKTVANITAQRTALSALRDEARIGGKAFNRLTEDIKKLDAQMGKSGKTTQGRRGGARQATQIAGAVISGGIFGGPEGALGAVGGAALGGVEGAFAGAAIGAQVKAFREALSASAEYAAQIGKLQIALEGVTRVQDKPVKSLANYNEALEAAAQSTRDYNVPQGAAIRGITRLTAAVTGAGGPVADAATTFQNVTAAIKATGGSTEDVRGAITAMVQVFSKGKVSAEELSGQLGERLPGAVTLFAKANDMTLPELQKNLKAGTVGLNELMNFIRQLGEEFDATAKDIASSNEEAGARLTVAFDNMKLNVGNALKDTGAEFQNIFGRFVQNITPAVTKAAEALAQALIPVAKNLDLILVSISGLVAGAAIGAAIKGFIALKTAILGVKTVSALLLLNPIFGGALAVAGIVAGIYAITKAFRAQRSEVEQLAEATRNIPINQLSQEDRLTQMSASKARLSSLRARRMRLVQAGKDEGGIDTTDIDADIAKEEKRLQRLANPIRKKTDKGGPFKYNPVVDEDEPDSGSGTKDTLARRVKQAQELERRTSRQLLLSQSEGQIGRLLAKQANDRAVLAQKIADLKKEGTSDDLNEAAQGATQNLQKSQELDLQTRINKLYETATNPLEKGLAAIKERLAADRRYKELLQKGIEPARARDIINLEKLKKKGLDILDIEIAALRAVIAKDNANKEAIETLDELLRKRKELEEKDPEEETGGNDYGDAKSDFESFKDTFEDGLKDMIDIGPKIANVALGAIGSVTDGLIEMAVTGKANFKEMAASILKDLAKIILKAAMARIVASVFGINLAAKGMIVQGGAKKPYARGGIVSAPTVFPMAGGDIGLMGEAGPEAIMPLKRGNNGKLGVEVAGRSNALEAMSRYSVQNNGRGSVGSGGTDDPSNFGGEASPQPIDVRYNVERINSVDYVTAQEFQAGMRQAADQGAKQGEQKALRRLQMSSSTRKRLGV